LPRDPKTNDLSDSSKARCMEIYSDATIIAIGFYDGSLRIFDSNLKMVREVKDR